MYVYAYTLNTYTYTIFNKNCVSVCVFPKELCVHFYPDSQYIYFLKLCVYMRYK